MKIIKKHRFLLTYSNKNDPQGLFRRLPQFPFSFEKVSGVLVSKNLTVPLEHDFLCESTGNNLEKLFSLEMDERMEIWTQS
jgi:hypothetical protein